MSRLATRIRNAGAAQARPIGFSATPAKTPRAIVIVAPAGSAAEVTAAVEAGADAISFDGAVSDIPAAIKAAGDTPIGVVLEAASGDDVQTAADTGADFFAFDDGAASPAALQVDDIGRIAILGDDRSEEAVRLLAGVNLDALFVDRAEVTSVRAQLALRQLASWANAPLLAGTTSTDVDALTALRDAGAGAILARGDLAATIAAADEVKPPKRAPSTAQPLVPAPPGDDFDDDDDF